MTNNSNNRACQSGRKLRPPKMGRPVRVTKEQRQTIDQAVHTLRQQEGDLNISEGRALELIAADFIAGAFNG